ncbi:hypothetical protein [Actinomycetospora sp. NBC_00405]|uniref:hypothetical protein n=1 Tax=Actinomycetospora sp. NBC_00405 TaxID=2975952 RepID=UPI002E1F2CA8
MGARSTRAGAADVLNALPPVVVGLVVAALSFLGLGAAPDSPEWGAVLADSLAYVERAPWTIIAPATGLVLLALVVALVRVTRTSS